MDQKRARPEAGTPGGGVSGGGPGGRQGMETGGEEAGWRGRGWRQEEGGGGEGTVKNRTFARGEEQTHKQIEPINKFDFGIPSPR